jgi:hypothetical protein
MSEEVLIDIKEESLVARVDYIKEELNKISYALRSQLSGDMSNEELLESIYFKQWIISNEIIKKINEGGDYNRLLYFLYEKCDNNILYLMSHYDIDFETDQDGNITKINLVILEEQDE